MLCDYVIWSDNYRECSRCGNVQASAVDRPCPALALAPASRECTHRGDEVRREWCSPCKGWLKVFSCALHGECMIGKSIDGITSCTDCHDRPDVRQPFQADGQADGQAGKPNVRLTPVTRLAVVTSFFNPHHSRRRVQIYPRFAQSIQAQGLPLYCAEGLFPGMRSQIDSTWQLAIDADAQFWHKESLLNAAIARLPDKYDCVSWIDADVIYDQPGIGDRILEQLAGHAVVQPWSRITYLGPDDQPLPGNPLRSSMAWHNRGRSRRSADSRHCFPGGVWAARRETLAQCGGMYDEAITGGGDVVWAAGVLGDAAAIEIANWPPAYRSHMLEWAGGLTRLTGGHVGSIDVEIQHLYHGSRADRQYVSRHEALRRHRFDPRLHLQRTAHGMLRWSPAAPPALRTSVRQYIHSRREDD